MMRLLGVLVGSTLAVVALVVFVGIPEFTAEPDLGNQTVITLPIRPRAAATRENQESVEATGEASADTEVAALPTHTSEPAAPGAVSENQSLAESAVEHRPASPVVLEELQHWYAFWSPFRSKIAADGFVHQLQRVTGLDYRVVRVKPGVYEVAFAYSSDDEITAHLSQISAATGLKLPEG